MSETYPKAATLRRIAFRFILKWRVTPEGEKVHTLLLELTRPCSLVTDPG